MPNWSEPPLERVQQLLRVGNLDQAIDECRIILASYPKSAQAHHLLGVSLSQNGQHAEAILVERSDALTNMQYNVMNTTELETLLKWHNVPKATKEMKASMVARWATIWEGGQKPPFFEVWTDVNEAKLEELKAIALN